MVELCGMFRCCTAGCFLSAAFSLPVGSVTSSIRSSGPYSPIIRSSRAAVSTELGMNSFGFQKQPPEVTVLA